MITLNECIKTVLLSGDTHGSADTIHHLLKIASDKKCDALFVLGDFGVWSHLDEGEFIDSCSIMSIETRIPIYFLPGNHENYDLLDEWQETNERDEDGFVTVADGVFYSPRGHRWIWGGARFLSLGGAYSVDKASRVKRDAQRVRWAKDGNLKPEWLSDYALSHTHLTWWPQEEISDVEVEIALKGGEVDIMLTHDKPLVSQPRWNRKNLPECIPNQEQIQTVVDFTKPSLLMHGHLHHAYTDTIGSTKTFVVGLDCDPDASLYSGGSGKIELSCAKLRLGLTSPEGESYYTLEWVQPVHKFSGTFPGDVTNRDFLVKKLEG